MTRCRFDELARFRQRRQLTAAEYAWAQEVLGDTLPRRERIQVSPALGRKRRPFTFPGLRGTVTMYLGPRSEDPVRDDAPLFAHELTHVWQLHHAPHPLPWLVRAIITQLRFSSGTDVYAIGDGTAPWGSYGLEQQATVVERWVAHRHDAAGRRLEHYLDDDVRAAGQPS